MQTNLIAVQQPLNYLRKIVKEYSIPNTSSFLFIITGIYKTADALSHLEYQNVKKIKTSQTQNEKAQRSLRIPTPYQNLQENSKKVLESQ